MVVYSNHSACGVSTKCLCTCPLKMYLGYVMAVPHQQSINQWLSSHYIEDILTKMFAAQKNSRIVMAFLCNLLGQVSVISKQQSPKKWQVASHQQSKNGGARQKKKPSQQSVNPAATQLPIRQRMKWLITKPFNYM